MNPHAFTKSARRLLMALAAMSSILLIAGCGNSSSTTTPNPVGFTTASLTGTYVFSSQGFDNGGLPLAVAGALVSNGTGGITGGTMDVIDAGFTTIPATAAQAITSGSYAIASDGRGQASLTSAYGTYIFDFVLTSTSHGLVSEFDGHGDGSGTLDLQAAVASQSALAGPYAFSLAGSDGSSNLAPFAAAGAFTLDQNGNITTGTGIEDFNDAAVVGNEPLTAGAATLGSGTGPGAVPLAISSFPNAAFDFYPIDAAHWKLIETDYNDFLAGDAFTQTGASTIPTAAMAFTMTGGIGSPIAAGGFVTVSGTSVTGTADVNADGSVVTGTTIAGTASTPGAVGGRVVISFTDFNPATRLAVYPSSGGLLMLETDQNNVTVGAAQLQAAGVAIGTSQAYGLSLSAFNTGGPNDENDIAQFTTSSGGFTGTVDVNDNFFTGNTALASAAFSDTTALAVDSTGRCQASTIAAGGAFVSFICYAVSSNTFLLLETDSNQIGVGTFELQSAPSSAAVAHRAISMVRPMTRSHAVKRRN